MIPHTPQTEAAFEIIWKAAERLAKKRMEKEREVNHETPHLHTTIRNHTGDTAR